MNVVDKSSAYSRLIGLRVTASAGGRGACALDVEPKHHNSNGVAHGGVAYSLVDTAMGAALYSTLKDGGAAATVEIKISYFKPITTGPVVAEARVVHRSLHLATIESDLSHDGTLVAKALGTFRILKG